MAMFGPKRSIVRYQITRKQRAGFWTHVRKTPTCWLWTGGKNASGYGLFAVGACWRDARGTHRCGRTRLAHRVGYQIQGGRLLRRGFDLDHVKARGCTSKLCVRRSHLEPVHPLVNCTRDDVWAWNREKTYCKNGHEYSGANLRSYKGSRVCRTCVAAAGRRYRARLRGVDVPLRAAGCAPRARLLA